MDGYKIIDLGGITLEDGVYNGEIEGVYNALDISNKPIVITGINGVKPAYVTFFKFKVDATTYAYIGILGLSTDGIQTITIASDDIVDVGLAN